MKNLRIRKQSKIKEYSVLVGTPVPMIDKNVKGGLANCVAGLIYRKIALPYYQDSRSAEVGRNVIIEDFLNDPKFRGFDYLLFFDADSFPVETYAVERMIRADRDVIAGVTPIAYHDPKTGEFGMYWNVFQKSLNRNLFLHELPDKPFCADKIGGSCILLKRKVLEKLEPPYQKPEYDEKYIHFVKGEDYYFCEKLQAAGFKIWVDPEIHCHHFHVIDLYDNIVMLARYAQQTEAGRPKQKSSEKEAVSIGDNRNGLNG